MKILLTVIILSLITISCSYNKDELVIEPVAGGPGSGGTGGTGGTGDPTITYTNFVKTMIDSNKCLQCHILGGAAAFRNYTTYGGIKAVAISGELKRRAIDGVAPTMPLGFPELSQETKDTLLMWIDQGALQ